MTPHRLGMLAAWGVVSVLTVASARPTVTEDPARYTITGSGYRISFARDSGGMSLELSEPDGTWQPVARTPIDVTSALLLGAQELQASPQRATLATVTGEDFVAVSRRTVLGLTGRIVVQLEYLCADEGVVFGAKVVGDAGNGVFWSPPRFGLQPDAWDSYAFYAADGRRHEGKLTDLQPPAYAGVSAWGPQGDTAPRFDPKHPALIVRSTSPARALGVVYLDYDGAWQGAYGFLQRHKPDVYYLYAGYASAASDRLRWAWLAPFGPSDPSAEAARTESLLKRGDALVAAYTPPAADVPEDWLKPVPDFPAALRRPAPVTDIRDAVVYTINEDVNSPDGVELAGKVGSDVLIRAWFKWGQRPPVEKWTDFPKQVHAQGALFGGGITCSALYDDENGLTPEQLADMATRGPDGRYVDAWDQPRCRHGSLSSPAYLDYLFRWCKEQMDAGADYLFMDENTAALSEKEGYDDHSLADLRRYLLQDCPQTQGWKPGDPRWREMYGVALDNREICPDGTMGTFEYRAYMRALGVIEKPNVDQNKLSALFWQFRAFRDDRAWKALTDRMRAYAQAQGRPLLISGNGLVKYVDLQVLGVWNQWTVKDGHVDLSENQLPYWRSLVERGQAVAGKPVPVVLFHDWGFGETPFPWMAISPADRELWMRTRGPEIYAAGGFFAFPVLGPFGCNAAQDGTLRCIAQQTTFFQTHRDLYLKSRYLGCEQTTSDAEHLSLAAWWNPERKAVLVHVINRAAQGTALVPRANVTIRLPLPGAPQKATTISPDAAGEAPVVCRQRDGKLEFTLPSLAAYTLAVLTFDQEPDLAALTDPVYVRPTPMWGRPPRNEFRVKADGNVEDAQDLGSFLQGRLHVGLRNPPTFLVKAAEPGRLEVHVRAVATLGARLELSVDGKMTQAIDLPDLDQKNDGVVGEYDRTFTFEVPAGEHRLSLDNVGGDWAVIDWYAFRGRWLD